MTGNFFLLSAIEYSVNLNRIETYFFGFVNSLVRREAASRRMMFIKVYFGERQLLFLLFSLLLQALHDLL